MGTPSVEFTREEREFLRNMFDYELDNMIDSPDEYSQDEHAAYYTLYAKLKELGAV